MMSRIRQSGISLIIIAILLVIIGTAIGTAVMRKDREAEWNPKTGSATDISRVKDALVAFQRANHRLPCVAPRNALPNTASYGEELANCAGGAAASGGTIRINLGTEYLRIGAVPHKTLGLSESSSEDQWKNRMTYAVTESLTDVFQFSNHSGAITVNDEGTGNVISDAAFVVVSHGKDGKGAYGGKTGSIGKTCLITAGKDQANCNDSDGVFVSANMESASGTNFFDDMLAWAQVDSTAQSSNMPCMVATTGDATWGTGCSSNGYANMANGDSQNANNTNTSTHVGDVTLGCDNGTLTYTGGTCFRHCIASTQAWDGTCAGNVPLVNHSTTSGSVANTNSGYTGSATFACVDGTLTVDAHSCAPVVTGCDAQPVSWNGDCAGGLGASLAEGANTSINNTNSGFTGSVMVTCTGGNLVQSGASCTPESCDPWARLCDTGPMESAQLACEGAGGTFQVNGGSMMMNCLGGTEPSFLTRCCGAGGPPPCTPDGNPPGGGGCCNVDSDGNGQCGFQPPAGDPCLDNGYGSGCLISGSDYGNGCIGTDIFGNGTVCCAGCNLNCSARTENWGAGCSGSTPAINSGNSSVVTNSAGGFTGSVTMSCTNGTLSQSGASCTPAGAGCVATSKSWSGGGYNCTAMTTAVADGQQATAVDSMGISAPNGQGTATYLCTNGTLAVSPTSSSCSGAPACPGGCEFWDSACGQICLSDGEVWREHGNVNPCYDYSCDGTTGIVMQLPAMHLCQEICTK